ncbi:sulfurtransferase TusA family protein [candidate division KSB1 bacterium]|nr:sulfurtransferase TusA family protein [candidate division KSB1 bacterium]
MKADQTIDCLGLYCPMPIIKTSEKIREMSTGQILKIVADDEGIVEDLPNWCKMTGQQFLKIEQEAGDFIAYIKKAT